MEEIGLEYIMTWVVYPLISTLGVTTVALLVYIYKSDKKGGEKRDEILKGVQETLRDVQLMLRDHETRLNSDEKEITRLRDINENRA